MRAQMNSNNEVHPSQVSEVDAGRIEQVSRLVTNSRRESLREGTSPSKSSTWATRSSNETLAETARSGGRVNFQEHKHIILKRGK